jgi:hypothetical protein
MKNVISFIVLFVSVLQLSCLDGEKSTPTLANSDVSAKTQSSAQTKIGPPPVTQSVKPMLSYCDDGRYCVTRVGPWGSFDHYLAQDGKSIGYWFSPNGPVQLRQTYGFKRAVINEYEYATYVNTYGYLPENLLVNIDKTNPGATIDACPGVTEYYTDEPITGKLWGQLDIINVADCAHSRGKHYGVGEQGTFLFAPPNEALTYFNSTVIPHLDFITYTNYENWNSTQTNTPDQRPTWTYMKQFYGVKFDRVWISSFKDSRDWHSGDDEYANLLGHASNLGINIVFFFADAGTQRQLESFCDSGWRSGGWLRKFVQQVMQKWCCTTLLYDPGTCYLLSVTPFGGLVELYP